MKVYALSFFRDPASGYESPNAGSSQGVFFARYILPTIRAFHAVYKDWALWIYHDDRVVELDVWPELAAQHDLGLLRLLPQGKSQALCESMLWRLKPLWEPGVEVVACRDVDSLPMPRERVMLEEFCTSGAQVHAVLDSESHIGPLMGGMSAYRTSWQPCSTWNDFIAGWTLNQHGSDQLCLNDWWNKTTPHTLIHQRAEIVRYPKPWVTTRLAAPCVEPGDQVVAHIGAAYNIEEADRVYAR